MLTQAHHYREDPSALANEHRRKGKLLEIEYSLVGFVVIASNSSGVTTQLMTAGLDWMVDQNNKAGGASVGRGRSRERRRDCLDARRNWVRPQRKNWR